MKRKERRWLAAMLLALCCAASAQSQGTAGRTITVSGTEQNSGSVWDAGTATISVTVAGNTYTKTMGG